MMMNANQLSVMTMQKRDSALKIQGIDHGLSFHSLKSIGSAGIIRTAFIMGYPARTANISQPSCLDRSKRPAASGTRYARKATLQAMLASRTRLLDLLRNS